jgi:acylphosphatase
MMKSAKRCRVEGIVQGVGFRYFTQQQAVKLGITGYAQNLPDGSVEVAMEGTPEALAKLVTWLQHGPVTATVTSVEEQEVSCADFESFSAY